MDVQKGFDQLKESQPHENHPMLFHVLFLFALSHNWQDYIMCLRQELESLVSCPNSLDVV